MPRRFGLFVAIGLLGFVVQLTVLTLLTSIALWPWLPATALAVEAAVIHNYFWHERWTWSERRSNRAVRLARFHVANGLGSIAGNVVLMWVFVALIGMPPVAANVLAVAILSAANFAMADRWVFQETL